MLRNENNQQMKVYYLNKFSNFDVTYLSPNAARTIDMVFICPSFFSTKPLNNFLYMYITLPSETFWFYSLALLCILSYLYCTHIVLIRYYETSVPLTWEEEHGHLSGKTLDTHDQTEEQSQPGGVVLFITTLQQIATNMILECIAVVVFGLLETAAIGIWRNWKW